MFNTVGTRNFGLEIYNDSTTTDPLGRVTILPGSARIGNTVTTFDGSSTFYDRITDFAGTGTEYQNTLLYLRDFNGAADMTRSSSDVVS